MADITIDSNAGSFQLQDFKTHLIDPEKKDAAWGYKIFISNRPYLRTMYGGWYNGDAQLVRAFGNGTQSPDRYKVLFDPQDQEAIYMGGAIGTGWQIAPVIPVLRNRVLAELAQIPLAVDCRAIDPVANEQRNNDRLRLKAQPILDKKLAQLSAKIGYDQPIKSGFDKKILSSPTGNAQAAQGGMGIDLTDDDEINIIMEKDAGYYSTKIEMANETAIQSIFQYNQIDKLMQLCREDAFDLGICSFRCFINAHTGLPEFQYLDPSQLFISGSKFKDFKDAPFWYYRVAGSLADIATYFGDQITEQEAKDIWDKSAKRKPSEWGSGYPYGYTSDWRRWNMNDLLRVEIDLYYFEVRTTDVLTYEASKTKTGSTKRKKKNLSYEPPEESKYDKKKENYFAECWYGGFYVEGLTKVYRWEKLYNQDRDEYDPQKAHSSLNIYRFSEKGLTEQVIAYADDYQAVFLKRKHMVVKALPKGYWINWDALTDIDTGTAGMLTKMDIIKMFQQTGSGIYRTMNEMGEPIMANANSPHMEAANGIDPNIVRYTEILQELKLEIANTFGIPPLDASVSQSQDLLVGVQKATNAASISSRHFLFFGFQKVIEQTATRISCILQQLAESKSSAWDKVKDMVGNANSVLIESMNDLPLHRFGIFAKTSATESERQEFRQMIMTAYQRGNLDISDVLAIWWIPNLKLSVAMLNLKLKKRMAQAAQSQMQQLQFQAQSEEKMAQMELMLKKMDGDNLVRNTETGKKIDYAIEQLKQSGEYNKKLLQELSKKELKEREMENDKEYLDLEKQKESALINQQTLADHETIHEQKEADLEILKATPKPKAKS